MGLESATYIGDLNTANPTGSDQKSTLDNHDRLIKTCLKNSFPGFAGAILVSGTNGGAADAYTVTPTVALGAYGTNTLVVFTPNANNTGASTLNISGLGVKNLKSCAGAALVADELVSGYMYVAAYNGTEFRLIAPTKEYIDLVREYADSLVISATLPGQTGNGGRYIRTNGTAAAWDDPFPTVAVYTSSTTWVATTDTVEVEVVGGGGSSGTSNSGVAGSVGSGGAGGGYARKLLTGLSEGATYTITVGAGGAAVSGDSLTGNAGGTSSFSGTGITTVQATGGGAGKSMANSNAGGLGTGGDINIPGAVATPLGQFAGNFATGGASHLSPGGAPGADGVGYGAGAGSVYSSSTGKAGSAGVVILRYFS